MIILSTEFKSIIKVHDLNSCQFIYTKPNSHCQYQSPIFITNIKSPIFASNIKNPILIGNIKSLVLTSNIKKPSSYWKHQKPKLTTWHYQKPKLTTWHYFIKSPMLLILGKYYIIIILLKSPMINNTLSS